MDNEKKISAPRPTRFSKPYRFLGIADYKPMFNSSTKDEWIATQRCSTGVTEVGIKKVKNKK